MTSVVRVAVSVVESDGHVIVGIRPEGRPLAGFHEFPGGKCLPDETPRACLVRECEEETGLLVVPREHLVTTTQTYTHGTIELHFWMCSLAPDLPRRAALKSPFAWTPIAALPTLNFPDGNAEVLKIIGVLPADTSATRERN
ncbi:MAG: NUDIX domain-containing protein [Planctomycetaceae bacterium]